MSGDTYIVAGTTGIVSKKGRPPSGTDVVRMPTPSELTANHQRKTSISDAGYFASIVQIQSDVDWTAAILYSYCLNCCRWRWSPKPFLLLVFLLLFYFQVGFCGDAPKSFVQFVGEQK